jgi:hypothetical protein
MKLTSPRGLFGSLMGFALLAGAATNAMSKPSRRVLSSSRPHNPTEHDHARLSAAQAKRERRAARNRAHVAAGGIKSK